MTRSAVTRPNEAAFAGWHGDAPPASTRRAAGVVAVSVEDLRARLAAGEELARTVNQLARAVEYLAAEVLSQPERPHDCDGERGVMLRECSQGLARVADDLHLTRGQIAGIIEHCEGFLRAVHDDDSRTSVAVACLTPESNGRDIRSAAWRNDPTSASAVAASARQVELWAAQQVNAGLIGVVSGFFGILDALFLPTSPSVPKGTQPAGTNHGDPTAYSDTPSTGAEVITKAVFDAWKTLRPEQYNRFNTPIVEQRAVAQQQQPGFTDLSDILSRHRAARATWQEQSGAAERRDGLISTDVVVSEGAAVGIVVTIPGTQGYDLIGGDRSSTWLTNIQLIDKSQPVANLTAVREIIAQTKVQAGLPVHSRIPVMVVGHSQGGLIAASLAAQQHSPVDADQFEMAEDEEHRLPRDNILSRDNITHVLTAGSPVGAHRLRGSTRGLAWELTHDVVPYLDGAQNDPLAGFETLVHDNAPVDFDDPIIGAHRDTAYVKSFAPENLTADEQRTAEAFLEGSVFVDGSATLYHREFHVRRRTWAD